VLSFSKEEVRAAIGESYCIFLFLAVYWIEKNKKITDLILKILSLKEKAYHF
jgi:hypothetical protein